MATPQGPTSPASPQRRWNAPCPGCGAMVEFRSAAAVVAVCSYCRSTVVREGDTLRKIGVSAELFQDHTPLQLGAVGKFNGRAFTLVGRLQYGYGPGIEAADAKVEGSWNEWHALFSDGKSGWLCEDNGQYVFAFDVDRPAYVPTPQDLAPGRRLRVAGIRWTVASKVQARLLAAAGELLAPPPLGRTFPIADLRSDTHRVATLEYADLAKPQFSIGLPVRLPDLGLAGTREGEAAIMASRAFSCPACGASVEVRLADTQSITCGNCASLVDLSQGIGAELKAVRQSRLHRPAIALGSVGLLTIGEAIDKPWQVIGFAVKQGAFTNPDPDERFTWNEYLLYNREEGFAFLIDSQDGWTVFRTLTGTPAENGPRGGVTWGGHNFWLTESYPARVTYVEGEYYWRVDKGQRVEVQDYQGTGTAFRERLSRETTADEAVWSWGRVMPATVIARAFGVHLPERIALADVTPTSESDVSGFQVVIIVLVLLFVFLAETCSSCDPDTEDCSSRGSSSGQYHK